MRPCLPLSACRWLALAAAAGLSCLPALAAAPSRDPLFAARAVADLALEELRNVVVSSVSRHEQALSDAPASIYVISGDEIRRIGVTTLPEALRLAPNLQVAALDSRQYAITARGFNTNIANKLLVLVDGRTIYSPLFSGVFWDAQDFSPADIDRIEVISGPAGVAWGTNAVNGVINIVTRPAAAAQGTRLAIQAGNRERFTWLRHGTGDGEGFAARGHVKVYQRDASVFFRSASNPEDQVDGASAGLRADWQSGDDRLSVDAGLYSGHTGERPLYGQMKMSGGHLQARWSRSLGAAHDIEWQAYYDRSDRQDRYLLQERGGIFDTELRWRRRFDAHRVMAGAGYRHSDDKAEPGLVFAFLPPEQRLDWYSLFVQDELALSTAATITFGTRFERNPYTGWETLPSLRLGYRLSHDSLLWSAVSRAVRSPARLDREIYTPAQPPYVVAGGPRFRSEVAKVLEAGVRQQATPEASWSVSAFVQDYDHLRSAEIVGGQVLIDNQIEGQIRGLEAWGEWQPRTDWRLMAGVLYLDKRLHLKPGSNDPVGPSNLGNDPSAQWLLRSSHALPRQAEFSWTIRRVGRLPQPEVPAYTAVDAQLNWQASREMQFSLGVRNAFDPQHLEYDAGAQAGEVPRSVFVTLNVQLR